MTHKKDFELELRELIDSRRKTDEKTDIARALRTQAELAERDEFWPGPKPAEPAEPDEPSIEEDPPADDDEPEGEDKPAKKKKK